MARTALAHKTSKSRTSSAPSNASSRYTKMDRNSLAAQLPDGWDNSFKTVAAGSRLGVRNQCPHCEMTPPKGLSSYARWRWQCCHIASHKPRIVR
jgi:hypothetical protein